MIRLPRSTLALAALLLTTLTLRSQDDAPATTAADRSRSGAATALGIRIGNLPSGPLDAITDVAGVAVGHATVVRGDDVRTGVTVVVPHPGNTFRSKCPAAAVVGNGFGKLVGTTQVVELGELESPIALTNTLNVGKVMDALVGHVLEQPGNESVRSVNVVVGETNDGWLNDIRGRHVTADHVADALAAARAAEPVAEGCVGAGTGTRCFGWKGGIGTASRRATNRGDGETWTVGVLVQTNFGGRLTIAGTPVWRELSPPRRDGASDGRRDDEPVDERGSCMIVVATDAPLDARNLERLARRALVGMARTGASFSNGSGDYVLAFSTNDDVRIEPGPRVGGQTLPNAAMSKLFVACADATEAAIVRSLLAATTTTGREGHVAHAIPVDRLRELLR